MKKLSLIALVALIAIAPALAATRSEHHFTLTFSAKKANSATGVKFLTDRYKYKAPPQGQLADRVASLTFVMAPGTRTNTAAYPACTKQILTTVGPKGCPAKSLVGTGEASVVTGNPILDSALAHLKTQIFVKKGGLLTYIASQNQVIDLTMKGNKISANVPQKCLDPTDCTKGEAVLKVLKATLKPGKLITTPAKCPASHKWTNTVLYKYVNGDSERETSTSPCKG